MKAKYIHLNECRTQDLQSAARQMIERADSYAYDDRRGEIYLALAWILDTELRFRSSRRKPLLTTA